MQRLLTVLALAAALSAPATASASPRASLPDVEDEVMCPICGTPLNLSESPQADRERAFIRRLIAQGDTKAQIKDKLASEYGDEVLALPRGKGFSLAAYLVPIGALLVALAALGIAVPRWRRTRTIPAAPESPPLAESDARRLDDDLAHYDL